MSYPTKVQLIQRKESEQWYVNFPAAIAQAMEFEKGETVEWSIEDKGLMALPNLLALLLLSPIVFKLIREFFNDPKNIDD